MLIGKKVAGHSEEPISILTSSYDATNMEAISQAKPSLINITLEYLAILATVYGLWQWLIFFELFSPYGQLTFAADGFGERFIFGSTILLSTFCPCCAVGLWIRSTWGEALWMLIAFFIAGRAILLNAYGISTQVYYVELVAVLLLLGTYFVIRFRTSLRTKNSK